MDRYKILEQCQAYGEKQFVGSLVEAIKSGEVPLNKFSIREVFAAFVGNPDRPMQAINEAVVPVETSSFSTLTGNVIQQQVQKAYDELPSQIDRVATVISSKLKQETFPGIAAFAGDLVVAEGDEYPNATFSDRYTRAPEPDKRGLMVHITDEIVKFDQSGEILRRASEVGRVLRNRRENDGWDKFTDTSNNSFYPSGSQAARWRTVSAGALWYNKVVNVLLGNCLIDWTSINEAWGALGEMADEADRLIEIVPNTLVVPYQLRATAWIITNSSENSSANGDITTVSPSAMGAFPSSFQIVSSPHIPDSNFGESETTWYMGQTGEFIAQEIFPIETDVTPGDRTKDIVSGFRTRMKVGFSWIDDKKWIMNTCGS